ncbi:MAG: AbrB/MazE/SpoVT family DNA-binding domain-containing protein [Steroidobacteraceae bacterium]
MKTAKIFKHGNSQAVRLPKEFRFSGTEVLIKHAEGTSLLATGRAIGPYDMLIAAHARSMGATIVTNNEREFRRVPGLEVQNWLKS